MTTDRTRILATLSASELVLYASLGGELPDRIDPAHAIQRAMEMKYLSVQDQGELRKHYWKQVALFNQQLRNRNYRRRRKLERAA